VTKKKQHGIFISGVSDASNAELQDEPVCVGTITRTVRLSTLSTNDFFFYDEKEYKVEVVSETVTVVLINRVMVNAGYPTLTEHVHGIAREEMSPGAQVVHTGHDTG